jgi:crotonobetainyl-CoA:carnitine CoA-transferase CaiB-like acyl-CoA transferase
MEEIFLQKTRDEWVAELSHLDACFGPVNDLAEAMDDPHVRARDMVREVPTPTGPVPTVGNPLKLRGDEQPPLRPAPGLGENTDEVLKEAGFTAEEIDALRRAGAL